MKKNKFKVKPHHFLPRHADGNVSEPTNWWDRLKSTLFPAGDALKSAASTGAPQPTRAVSPNLDANPTGYKGIDYVRQGAEQAAKRMEEDKAKAAAASKNIPAHQIGDVSAPVGGVPMGDPTEDMAPQSYGNMGRPSPMGQRSTPNPMGMPAMVQPGSMRPQPIGNVPPAGGGPQQTGQGAPPMRQAPGLMSPRSSPFGPPQTPPPSGPQGGQMGGVPPMGQRPPMGMPPRGMQPRQPMPPQGMGPR